METQYMLVQDGKKSNFEAEVQSRLREGWEAQGGVAVVGVGSIKVYTQALILKSD